MEATNIIPRDAIGTICEAYAKVTAAYSSFFDSLNDAHTSLLAAERIAAGIGAPRSGTHLDPHVRELAEFDRVIRTPENLSHLRVAARRLLKMRFWQAVLDKTELRSLMDRQALDELRKQMAYVPLKAGRDEEVLSPTDLTDELPEVTVDNVEAMLEGLLADAGLIWRRGLANAFAELDRGFRSHDGFKVGRRVVLPRAFNDYGAWCYYDRADEKIRDVERALLILDGKKPRDDYAGVLGAIQEERQRIKSGRWPDNPPGEVITDYFKVRWFKNGNVHLWFTRDDLLHKVNEELAEFYGARIGWGRYDDDNDDDEDNADPEAPFAGAAERALARRFGEFFSPPGVVEELMRHARLDSSKPLAVLEPSAGRGNIARRIADYSAGHLIDVVEIQAGWAAELSMSGSYRRVIHRDFLSLRPAPVYHRIVMNPPFDRWRDCDHVHHALKFLAPGGILVSVVSASTQVGQSPKATALRREVEAMGGRFWDLPAGSFREAGTEVNTAVLVVTEGSTRRHP